MLRERINQKEQKRRVYGHLLPYRQRVHRCYWLANVKLSGSRPETTD